MTSAEANRVVEVFKRADLFSRRFRWQNGPKLLGFHVGISWQGDRRITGMLFVNTLEEADDVLVRLMNGEVLKP